MHWNIVIYQKYNNYFKFNRKQLTQVDLSGWADTSESDENSLCLEHEQHQRDSQSCEQVPVN